MRNLVRSLASVAAAAALGAVSTPAPAETPASARAITWPYVSEALSPVEEITVASPTGFEAPVVLRRPPGDGPLPLVVVVHGGLGTATAENLRNQASGRHNVVRMLAAGYAIAVPTYSPRAEDPQTDAALRDCLAVIEHVRDLPGIDSESVFIFGGSGGGSLALELAGETDLAAIAAGEPASILFTGVWTKDNIPERNAIMEDPLAYCDTPETRAFTRAKIDRIACPVLIVHSDVHPINKINDVFVIPMMAEAGKAPEICFVPGVRHGFYFSSATGPGEAEATLAAFETTEAFFRRHSKTPPAPIDASKLELRPVSEGQIGADDTPPEPQAAAGDAGDIDWDRVRELRRRALAGEALAPEEQDYYDRGRAAWPPR